MISTMNELRRSAEIGEAVARNSVVLRSAPNGPWTKSRMLELIQEWRAAGAGQLPVNTRAGDIVIMPLDGCLDDWEPIWVGDAVTGYRRIDASR